MNTTSHPLNNSIVFESTSYSQTIVGILLLLISLLSFPPNILVIVISLKEDHIDGVFKWFLLHLAFVDTIIAVCSILEAYIVFNTIDGGTLCMIVSQLFMYLVPLLNMALLPVMLNRYISLYHSDIYDTVFTKANIILMFLFIHLTAFLTCVVPLNFVWVSPYGKRGYLCTFLYTAEITFTHSIYVVTLLSIYELSLLFIFIIGIAVWKKIKEREKLQLNLEQKEALKRTRELLYATMVQAIGPIVLQTPMVVLSIIEMFNIDMRLHLANGDTFLLVTYMMFLSNPLMDAYATVIIVKKYRDAAKKLCVAPVQFLKCPNNNVQPVSEN